MGLLIAIIVILVLTVVSAIAAAEEAAIVLLSPGRLQRLVEADSPGASALEKLAEQTYRFRAAAALVSAIAYVVSATAAMWAVVGLFREMPIWVAGAIGAVVAMVIVYSLGHALPRTIAVPRTPASPFRGLPANR